MKDTYFPSEKFITKKWFIIDATDKTLGRLATKISKILVGKEKSSYTPFLDNGVNIIVINAEKNFFVRKKGSSKRI